MIAVIPPSDGFPEVRVVGREVPPVSWVDSRASMSPTPGEAVPVNPSVPVWREA